MASVSSRSSSNQSTSDLFYMWPTEQLSEYVNSTIKANKVLKEETEMFVYHFAKIETYVKTSHKSDVYSSGKSPFISSASTESQISQPTTRTPYRVGSRSSRANQKSPRFEKMLKLKAEQKCYIALKEIVRLKELQRKENEDSEHIADNFKAIIEEITERISNIKKEEYEFERDIVQKGINPKNDKVFSEKVVRYFENKIKYLETCMSKLRLKRQSLKQQTRKCNQMLRHKEQIGDILTEIDFQQLKIENAERMERIEERNKDFFRLKTDGTITAHTFNDYKKKLHKTMLESTQLKQEIASRNSMIVRLDMETRYCESERAKAETINKKLRAYLTSYRVPHVMDAVYLYEDLIELQKKVNIWERKNQIAEMALTTEMKRWSRMKADSGEADDKLLAIWGDYRS